MVEPFEPDRGVLEALARLEAVPWSGTVWRHTFADNPPEKTNLRGARWNPPGVEALYVSLDRATAIAEADYAIAVQPLRPRARRTIHQLEVALAAVLDLTDPRVLASLGIDLVAMTGDDHRPCQAVGRAAAFLHVDGIIVPSVRCPGQNVVILFSDSDPTPTVEIRSSEVLPSP